MESTTTNATAPEQQPQSVPPTVAPPPTTSSNYVPTMLIAHEEYEKTQRIGPIFKQEDEDLVRNSLMMRSKELTVHRMTLAYSGDETKPEAFDKWWEKDGALDAFAVEDVDRLYGPFRDPAEAGRCLWDLRIRNKNARIRYMYFHRPNFREPKIMKPIRPKPSSTGEPPQKRRNTKQT